MSQSLSRNFRRNQKDTRRNISLRLARLEHENNELAFTLMKNMAIAEGISHILIDKELCTKEEYNEALKESAKMFNLIPSDELAKETKEKITEEAKEIEKEIALEEKEEAESVEEGDPRGEPEEPNPEFEEKVKEESNKEENSGDGNIDTEIEEKTESK